MTDARRDLPSVSVLLAGPGAASLLVDTPRDVVVDAIRAVLDEARRDAQLDPRAVDWDRLVVREGQRRKRPTLRRVINATGIVLHTNLARAPLAEAAVAAISDVALGYANLEYDLATGERGSRYVHCVGLLTELTGAEDALVVNNCAGALVLALAAAARGKQAIVSRGELIEIGGGFRVPDIMAASGTTLVEVGTTNRTRVSDYAGAITPDTGALVKIHRSNFTIEGFVAEATSRDLAPLAATHGIPLIEDFGSGLMLSLASIGLGREPTAREVVANGASLVLMSGDKLLGGPQAGIILGTKERVAQLRAHPLARSYRVDKLTIAALGATLALYRTPERARERIPVLRMLHASSEALEARARTLAARLTSNGVPCAVVATESAVGGGAFPTARLSSFAVALEGHAETLARLLREDELPVIARIVDGRALLDLRTVDAGDLPRLASVVEAVLAKAAEATPP